ncbi:hypothetical protein V7O61_00765 [Methanolobus sp. WCC1]|uniref:hypothetical protein n=1 Tax=unclassified Methanolobus TaxID=2629569 RepID=UPI00258E2087|nr:hypothetical protein [Methanolobus sp.]
MTEDESNKQICNQLSFESLKYVLNLQNEGIKEIGNKANNSLLIGTFFVGVTFTVISIDSSFLANIYYSALIVITISIFLISIILSLAVMYMVAFRSIPVISTEKVYMCLFDSELDENCIIGTLLNLKEYNEEHLPSYRRWSLCSYILLLTGILLELIFVCLVF